MARNNTMKNKLQQNISQLKQFNRQRKLWLFLSFFVISSILGIVFDWNHIQKYQLEWSLGTAGLVVAAVWWYWTMRLIRHLIEQKTTECEILTELVVEIKTIKEEVRTSLTNPIDKDK